MFSFKQLAVLAVTGIALNAQASIITIQNGYSTATAQTSAAAYRDVVNAAVAAPAGAGYGSKVVNAYDGLNNRSLFNGTGRDIAWKGTVDFSVTAAEAGLWTFRTGVDFTYGGALFLDNAALAFRNTDMWWGQGYTAPAQFLQGTINLAAGNYTLTVFGLENCCDGTTQAQFKAANSTTFKTFSKTDGLTRIPEPATLATIALGLGLMGASRRRKRA
jgi:hypothetical protein